MKCRQARHYTASGGQIRKTGVTIEKAAAYLVCAACLIALFALMLLASQDDSYLKIFSAIFLAIYVGV